MIRHWRPAMMTTIGLLSVRVRRDSINYEGQREKLSTSFLTFHGQLPSAEHGGISGSSRQPIEAFGKL